MALTFREVNTSGTPPRDAAKIVRTTIHRVTVGVLKIKLLAFGVLFSVGPEQDLNKAAMVLPSVNQQVFSLVIKNLSQPEGLRMQVTNSQLATPALIRSSATLKDVLGQCSGHSQL